MRMNPVYKRESMVSARSVRLALVLMVLNGILALVALLNMYSTLAQVRLTAEIQYTSFLNLYVFLAVLEFIMVIFIMPALTAGSISGERERRTLELMLTTKMTPADIVLGKLMASLSTMGLLVISSFPILAMVFVYGGVTMKDIGLLLLCYAAAAFFVGSLGVCCSTLFQKSTFSTVAAYCVMGIIVFGTYGINQFALYINQVQADAYLVSVGQSAGHITSGHFLYLLLANPTTTFAMTLLRLAGREMIGSREIGWIGNHELSIMHGGWVTASIIIQLVMAAVFLGVSVWALTPKKPFRPGAQERDGAGKGSAGAQEKDGAGKSVAGAQNAGTE